MKKYHLEANENEIIERLTNIVKGTWHWEPSRTFSLAGWNDQIDHYDVYSTKPIYTPEWWSKPGVEMNQAPAKGYLFTTYVAGDEDMEALIEVLNKFGIQSKYVRTPGIYIPQQANLLELLQKQGEAINQAFVAKSNELEISNTLR